MTTDHRVRVRFVLGTTAQKRITGESGSEEAQGRRGIRPSLPGAYGKHYTTPCKLRPADATSRGCQD